jgi:peptidoglycan/LPS O-acetylase OafA/YrhL
MRWVLAVLVVAGHIGGFATPEKAYLAVDFFFILSGFVLTAAYRGRADRESFVRDFIVDRIARLYPLHLGTLLLLVGMNLMFWMSTGTHLEAGWSYKDGLAYTFGLNLLMLQNVGLTTSSSWNAPSWSISVEFIVNIGLAFVVLWMARRRLVWPFLAAAIASSYAVLYVQWGTLEVFYQNTGVVANAGLLRGIGGVSLGMVVFLVFEALKGRVSVPLSFSVATTCCITLLAALSWGGGIAGLDFLTIPLMFATVLALALAEHSRPSPDGRIRDALETLGASSYAVYLIHWPILTFITYQVDYAWGIPIDFSEPVMKLGLMAIIAVSAFPIFLYFELPAKRWCRRYLRAAPFALGRPMPR